MDQIHTHRQKGDGSRQPCWLASELCHKYGITLGQLKVLMASDTENLPEPLDVVKFGVHRRMYRVHEFHLWISKYLTDGAIDLAKLSKATTLLRHRRKCTKSEPSTV